MMPFKYKGKMEIFEEYIKELTQKYSKYYNFIINYFKDTKIKYFQDNSFNYSLYPEDVKSNSVIENYNKTKKSYLGDKRECNWVTFMNFITDEIKRITIKKNKFYKNKSSTDISKNTFLYNNINNEQIEKIGIKDKWLVNFGENCRYISFITLYYFIFMSYANQINNKEFNLLKKLNKLVQQLADNVNNENLNLIIKFFQINKLDVNNELLDKIKYEKEQTIQNKLIEEFKKNNKINYYSSGYIASLFNIFNDIPNFCIIEKKMNFVFYAENQKKQYQNHIIIFF